MDGIVSGNMEDGCMGLKHSSQNFTCFGGDMFRGLGLPKHQNMCWDACGWWVSKFKFWGSCFMAYDFQPAETSLTLSMKHAIFPCWFTLELVLLVHANLCHVALKWTMHLWLVVEITSRYITLKIIPTKNTSWTWLHANASMATGLMHPWLHSRCIHGYRANASMAI